MKKYKLPKKFATKWVAALRSGKYKQGRGYLYHCDKFCCLGVAGAICNIGKLKMKDKEIFNGSNNDFIDIIPDGILDSRANNSLVRFLTDMNDLVDLNGIHKNTFEDIADWIETNIEFI